MADWVRQERGALVKNSNERVFSHTCFDISSSSLSGCATLASPWPSYRSAVRTLQGWGRRLRPRWQRPPGHKAFSQNKLIKTYSLLPGKEIKVLAGCLFCQALCTHYTTCCPSVNIRRDWESLVCVVYTHSHVWMWVQYTCYFFSPQQTICIILVIRSWSHALTL